MTVIRPEREGTAERDPAEAARLTSLLQRAGVDGTTAASHTGATSRLGNTGSSRAITSDAVVKVQAKVEELQLGPVTAPRTELNQKLSESARSFVQNVDRVMTTHLTRTASALTAQNIQLERGDSPRLQLAHTEQGGDTHTQREPGTIEQQRAVANENVLARLLPSSDLAQSDSNPRRGLERVIDDNADERDTQHAAADAHGAVVNPTAHGVLTAPTAHNTTGAGTAVINTKAKPKTNATVTPKQESIIGQRAFRASTTALDSTADAGSSRMRLLDMSNLSSDQLLAEFLKLNINDPNMNVETQNKLYTLASDMRQLAIEEAKKRIERAQELMKEAQKYADQAEKYADMAGMIGIAAAFLGPLGAILSGIMQIVVAVMQYQAQMMMLDAKEEKNNAERFKLMGDMHQNQVQETGEYINTIMEMKNQMIESVIAMLNASFSTRQQLMSAAMAR